MTMINRVAEAIWKSRLLVQPREPWSPRPGHLSVTEKFVLEAARAVIEAMRYPTPFMQDIGARTDVEEDDASLTYKDAQNVWLNMVDAALKEPK